MRKRGEIAGDEVLSKQLSFPSPRAEPPSLMSGKGRQGEATEMGCDTEAWGEEGWCNMLLWHLSPLVHIRRSVPVLSQTPLFCLPSPSVLTSSGTVNRLL